MIAKAVLLLALAGLGEPPGVRIEGPTERPAGRSVILKVTTDGADLKLVTTPPINNLLMFKILGSEQIGILFDPDAEGVYTFCAGVNRDNLTAVAIHQVRIGPAPPVVPVPGPTPKPPDTPLPKPPEPTIPDLDPAFTSKLQNAYTLDLAGGGKIDFKRGLAAGYRQGLKDFMNSKTNNELMGKQKMLNESLIGVDTMRNMRQVIGAEATAVLGSNSLAPLDKPKAEALWNKFISSLDRLTPP